MTAIFVEKASGQTNSVIIIFPKQSGTKTRFLLQSISTGFALQELTKKVTQSVSLIGNTKCFLNSNCPRKLLPPANKSFTNAPRISFDACKATKKKKVVLEIDEEIEDLTLIAVEDILRNVKTKELEE